MLDSKNMELSEGVSLDGSGLQLFLQLGQLLLDAPDELQGALVAPHGLFSAAFTSSLASKASQEVPPGCTARVHTTPSHAGDPRCARSRPYTCRYRRRCHQSSCLQVRPAALQLQLRCPRPPMLDTKLASIPMYTVCRAFRTLLWMSWH